MTRIASVVEGHGEVAAVPALLRQVAPKASILKPHRLPRGKMTSGGLDRVVRFQAARVEGDGGVLVLVDADDDDPVELADCLLGSISSDVKAQTKVVVAVREYEAWFLAGVESLRSHRAVKDDASYVEDPEAPRDAKGRLAQQMTEPYQETIHQVAFSAIVDLSVVASRSPSFRLFQVAVSELMA